MPRGTVPRARMVSVRLRSWTRSGPESECAFVVLTAVADNTRPRILACSYCLILLWCVFSTGCCRVLGLAYRTTIAEPRDYCSHCDKRYSLELYSQWADQAWRERFDAWDRAIHQPDYAVGFHDGFVA